MASRGRILIVDDEANARAALSEILRDEGYVTETAGDGFKALGKLEEFAPDVVLTDLKMPGLDGIAFMEKAKSASPQTVFVVMTAFGTIDSAVLAIKKGADNYLTKPLDYSALSAIVDRAMERRSSCRRRRPSANASASATRSATSSAKTRRCAPSSTSSRRSARRR